MIPFLNTAAGVWDELHDFSTFDSHKIFQLQKDLHALEQHDDSVEIYFHKLKHLWDESVALDPIAACSLFILV